MTRSKDAPPRAWQRMLSGRRLDLLDPSPFDVEIEDIAHGLSRVARWNGQTAGEWAYSVAQHSVLVERLVGMLDRDLPQRWRLATLLHDAPEYVIGDMITPFKSIIGPDYKTVEAALMRADSPQGRVAGRVAGDGHPADQAGRPPRRLPRSYPTRRVRTRRGPRLLRRAADRRRHTDRARAAG